MSYFSLENIKFMKYFEIMISFENYRDEKVWLHEDTLKHIQNKHKEINLEMIRETIKDPDEIRQSQKDQRSQLYYYFRKEDRYICVVVKICEDGIFISTVLTTDKIKKGIVIYKKGEL